MLLRVILYEAMQLTGPGEGLMEGATESHGPEMASLRYSSPQGAAQRRVAGQDNPDPGK